MTIFLGCRVTTGKFWIGFFICWVTIKITLGMDLWLYVGGIVLWVIGTSIEALNRELSRPSKPDPRKDPRRPPEAPSHGLTCTACGYVTGLQFPPGLPDRPLTNGQCCVCIACGHFLILESTGWRLREASESEVRHFVRGMPYLTRVQRHIRLRGPLPRAKNHQERRSDG